MAGRSAAFDGTEAGFGDDITFGLLLFPFGVPVVGGRGTGRLPVAGVAGVAGLAEPDGLVDTGRTLACGGRATLCAGRPGCGCVAPAAAFESISVGVAGDAGLGGCAALGVPGDPGFAGCAAFGIAPRTGCAGCVPAAG